MYCIEKWCFWSQILCFVLKNEEWGFLKTLSEKICILMYYIEKWVFEVNSFVLYWKMRISKNSFPKNVIFLCIILKNDVFEVKSYVFVLKNEEWGFLKTLSEKILHSYVLYWKMMFLKSILLFCIEKWGFQKTLSWKNSILMYYIEKWGFWDTHY